ncbi:hypothetical protein MOD31_05950 [Paenarthrobacter sp. TYUT067]|uniref:hypothetical protein n=2 Tax=Micrococcaceae TaxID=1268 RepID=UPI001E7F1AED|nr:hypothetical protein [Paenarthrobacter sp. TYUT067]MCM0615559.1 hypothetical protein [Paenarthrobacter sp. TYUT067]BCW64066.1 hypothetical protein StoSoilB22_30390 [Arthrobacter sp. StoSoilB22]
MFNAYLRVLVAVRATVRREFPMRRVPAAADAAAAQAAATGAGQPGPVAPRATEVVVEQGDTMNGIAALYGWTLVP